MKNVPRYPPPFTEMSEVKMTLTSVPCKVTTPVCGPEAHRTTSSSAGLEWFESFRPAGLKGDMWVIDYSLTSIDCACTVSVCLSVCPSVCLSVCLSLSLCLSVCLSLSLSLSFPPPLSPSLFLPLFRSFLIPVFCLTIHSSIDQCAHPSIPIPTPSIHPFFTCNKR